MQSSMQSSAVVQATGIFYCLAGLTLVSGGGWLAALGGSYFYVAAGVGVMISGGLLLAMRRSALWVFAAVLIGTLFWAVYEVGLDWWPLAARGDIIYPMGVWLLTPWITRRILGNDGGSYKIATLPLWLGVLAGGVVLSRRS